MHKKSDKILAGVALFKSPVLLTLFSLTMGSKKFNLYLKGRGLLLTPSTIYVRARRYHNLNLFVFIYVPTIVSRGGAIFWITQRIFHGRIFA